MVNDTAVDLLGHAVVIAAVARFHVENRNVQTFGSNGRKAAVGVAQYQKGIGLYGYHEFVAAVDDIAYCGSKI